MGGLALASIGFVAAFFAVGQLADGSESQTDEGSNRPTVRTLGVTAEGLAGLSPSAQLPALQKARRRRRPPREAAASPPSAEPVDTAEPAPEPTPDVTPEPAPPAPSPQPEPAPSPPPVRFYDEG